MGNKQTSRRSQKTPVIFPAIPWLIDGNKYEAYLESSMTHAQFQDCPDTRTLPVFLTDAYDPPVEFTMKEQVVYVTPKLNEIVEAFLETDATHLWFLNADNEVPPDALCKLLDHDVDIASGISPPHSTKLKSTAMKWMPPPSPEYSWSQPWFKMYRMKEIYGKVIGGTEIVVTGHFCMLCKRRVFEQFSPLYEALRFKYEPPQKIESVMRFWQEAQELGFVCRIDGSVLCGHLPEWPLAGLQEEYGSVVEGWNGQV